MRRLSDEDRIAVLPLSNFGGMVIKYSECGDYVEVQEDYGDDSLSEIVEVELESFTYDELDDPLLDEESFIEYHGDAAKGFIYEGEQYLLMDFMSPNY